MHSFKKKKAILFATFLVLFLVSVPKFSQIGFILSEYLTKQPGIIYLLAIAMSMVGFMKNYLQLAMCLSFPLLAAEDHHPESSGHPTIEITQDIIDSSIVTMEDQRIFQGVSRLTKSKRPHINI